VARQSMKENKTDTIYAIRRNPPIKDLPIANNKKTKRDDLSTSGSKSKKLKLSQTVEKPKPVSSELEKECEKLTAWLKYNPNQNDNCAICFETYTSDSDVVILKCSHHFCKTCIIGCYSQGFILCPMCKTCFGIRVGSMPEGNLKIETIPVGKCPLAGHESHGTIRFRMSFPDGIQDSEHPNPGQPYAGTSRTAYLPDTPEGRELLNLFKIAWKRKLLFRVGTSVTTGADNQVIWNGIHLKTQTHGGATNFGYPDDTYFERVKKELADKGIS